MTAVFLKSWPSAAYTISPSYAVRRVQSPGTLGTLIQPAKCAEGVLFVQGHVGGAVARTLKDPTAIGRFCSEGSVQVRTLGRRACGRILLTLRLPP